MPETNTLHEMLNFYDLVITRARSADGAKYGYMAYVQPSFGAASGTSHEVWAETFEKVIIEIEKSISEG